MDMQNYEKTKRRKHLDAKQNARTLESVKPSIHLLKLLHKLGLNSARGAYIKIKHRTVQSMA
jgi:hypothetical protein